MTNKISFFDILYSIASFRIKLCKAFDHLIGGAMACLLPSLPREKLPQHINKILIIRPGGIGDAVFLLPILKDLKNQGFIIDILCEKRNEEVFTSQALQRVPLRALFFRTRQSYDLVIDTEQWHYLSALTAYFVKSSYKIGFATRPKRAKLFHKAVDYDVDGYELDNFLRLFKDILKTNEIKKNEGHFDINAQAEAWAKEQIHGKFVTVFLGASIALRRLNQEQVMTIIHSYLKKDYSIALLGGKDVESFAQGIAVKINSSKIFNYAGKLSLIHSGALIQKSSLFIGPDSGLMHLACAINVPVLAIFGPGNLAKWGPKGEKHKVITENVPCSPCTRFGYTLPTCYGSYHCMSKVRILNENI